MILDLLQEFCLLGLQMAELSQSFPPSRKYGLFTHQGEESQECGSAEASEDEFSRGGEKRCH